MKAARDEATRETIGKAERFVLAAILMWSSLYFVVFPKWVVDDAYITFRYARNLVEHGELTWNVGEDPVEGYTGIALPLLLASMMWVGVSPELASHSIGVLSFLVGGVILHVLLRRLAVGPLVRSVTLLLYVAAPMAYTHALSGLETMLFTSLVTLSFLALLASLEPGRGIPRREMLLLSSLLGLSLVRPEGVALALTAILALLWLAATSHDRRLSGTLLRVVIIFVIPAGSYFLWRWSYYGQLLPNTFYVKRYALPINTEATANLLEWGSFYLLLPLVAGLSLLFACPRLAAPAEGRARARSPMPGEWLAYAAMLGFVAIVLTHYHRSWLAMNYSYRFFFPFFPLGLVVVALVGETGIRRMACASLSRRRQRVVLVIVVLASLGQAVSWAVTLQRELRLTRDYRQCAADQHFPAGRLIRDRVPATERLSVHIDAGVVPYTTGLPTLDFGALNDEKLAHRGLTHSERADYFFSFDPGVVVFNSERWDRLERPYDAAIYEDPRFARYVLVRRYRTREDGLYGGFHLFVYFRRDLTAEPFPR